MMQNKPCASFQ